MGPYVHMETMTAKFVILLVFVVNSAYKKLDIIQ